MTLKIIGIGVVILILLIGVTLSGFKLPFSKQKKAALQVTSNQKATVFLNDSHVGKTPYFDEQLNPGEYTLKLVPEGETGSLLTWQGIIRLNPKIMTVVNRSLAESEDKSGGYILTLEAIADKDKVQISVIGTPDNVVVALDGEPKGFAPLSLDNIPDG